MYSCICTFIYMFTGQKMSVCLVVNGELESVTIALHQLPHLPPACL